MYTSDIKVQQYFKLICVSQMTYKEELSDTFRLALLSACRLDTIPHLRHLHAFRKLLMQNIGAVFKWVIFFTHKSASQ